MLNDRCPQVRCIDACLILLMCTATIFGCAGRDVYTETSIIADLNIAFEDNRWNGESIPTNEVCRRDGGNGATPTLRIGNIPGNANVLTFEYSNKSLPRMDYGGNGIIGYRISPGTNEVVIPPLPGHTFAIQPPFYVIAAHNRPGFDVPGAYLPPCSGGLGHFYYLTVRAFRDTGEMDKLPLMVGQGRIYLGRY